jgi:hypothetical protein
MEGAGWRVAVETTGGALERSAGRAAGPEVHQPGDSARENLAVSSPGRATTPGKAAEQKNPFREGSKAAQVYALLGRPEGATRREIEELTDWERHRVRGFLSAGVRKQGYKLRLFLRAGERVYRLKG